MSSMSPNNQITLPQSPGSPQAAESSGAGGAGLMELAQAATVETTEAIGRVAATDGLVEDIHADGSRAPLVKGDPIFQGDTIETGKGAAIGITFVDDSTFSLGGNGQMTIDEMVYDPGTRSGVMKSSMAVGVFSFVSGQIARSAPDAMTVQTPVATIGVRGTKVAGVAAPEGQPNSISLLPETDSAGHTFVGELSVSNSVGMVVLNQTGATVRMFSAFIPLPPPMTFSPTQIQQQYSIALAALPQLPPPPGNGEGNPTGNQGNQGDQQGDASDGASQESDAAAAAEQAAQAAIAAGASPEDVFAAAAAAAEQQQLAEGGSPEDIAAARAVAEQAFQDALASGMTPEEAIQVAIRAEEALGNGPDVPGGQFSVASGGNDLFGPGLDGGNLFGPGPDGGNPFGGNGNGSLFGGGGNDLLGNPFDSLGGLLGGGDFPVGGQRHDVFNDTENINNQPVVDQTTFTSILRGTTANDILSGDAENTNFYFSYPGGTGGSDTITDSGGTNQIAFDQLDNVKIKVTMGMAADTGDFSIWGSHLAIDTDTPLSTISFSDVSQFLFADADVTALQSGYSSYTGDSFSAPSSSAGDVVVLPTLNASEVGYVFAGTSSNDTFDLKVVSSGGSLDDATSGVIAFGKGGDDTFNITSPLNALLIGGSGSNTFSYSGYVEPDAPPIGVNATLQGFSGEASVDGLVTSLASGSNLSNMIWDVGTFVGSNGNDLISLSGSDNVTNAPTIDGGYSTDVLTLAAGGQTVTVSNVEIINGGTGADTVTLAAGGQTVSVSGVETINGGSGYDYLILGSSETLTVSGIEDIFGSDYGDTLTLSGGGTVYIEDVNTINSSAGVDILTIYNDDSDDANVINASAGADTFNLTTNHHPNHTVSYSANLTSEAGDTITSFAAGGEGDVINFATSTLVNGIPTATLNEITATNGVIGGNDVFIALGGSNFSATDTGTAAGAAAVMSGLDTTNITSGDKVIVAMDDNTDTHLWYYQENGGDGVAQSGELTEVATISGMNDAANFADGDLTVT